MEVSERHVPEETRRDRPPTPFCHCWNAHDEKEPGNPDCGCGEEVGVVEWRWEIPRSATNWVTLCNDEKHVTFHPFYSSGTAVVKGNVDMEHNNHYYWEVKMLTEPYGTDIMVGLGSQKLNLQDALYDYRSFLGGNDDSYGLSYTGAICRNNLVIYDCPGFTKGTIIGVRVDFFRGTLEFYLNREPQGIAFNDLRRHQVLFPMLSSTAAQSAMRLIYASSWKESLLVEATKVLAASATDDYFLNYLPPGLALILRNQFWMTLPSAGRPDSPETSDEAKAQRLPAAIRRKHWHRRW